MLAQPWMLISARLSCRSTEASAWLNAASAKEAPILGLGPLPGPTVAAAERAASATSRAYCSA